MSEVFIVKEHGSRMPEQMRQIYCYDRKTNPKAETSYRVFYIYKWLEKNPSRDNRYPFIHYISAYLPNTIQVVMPTYADDRSLKYYQNQTENGAMTERFVSACARQVLLSL